MGQTQLWAWNQFSPFNIHLFICLTYLLLSPVLLAHLTLHTEDLNHRTTEIAYWQDETAVFIMHSQAVAMGYKGFQDHYLNKAARPNSGIH